MTRRVLEGQGFYKAKASSFRRNNPIMMSAKWFLRLTLKAEPLLPSSSVQGNNQRSGRMRSLVDIERESERGWGKRRPCRQVQEPEQRLPKPTHEPEIEQEPLQTPDQVPEANKPAQDYQQQLLGMLNEHRTIINDLRAEVQELRAQRNEERQ
ncbi:hypothetical protein K1719_010471 [Acacia pycnantha]|nr:hypothetical protein K1719_010471 [Acacia pycnantha]